MQQIIKAIGKFLSQQKLFFLQKKQGAVMPICRGTAWVVLFPWFKSCGDQHSAPTPTVTTPPTAAAKPATPTQTTVPPAAITPAAQEPAAQEPAAEASSEHDPLPPEETPPAPSTGFEPSAPAEEDAPPPYSQTYDPDAPPEKLKYFDLPPTYEQSQQANNQQNPPAYDGNKGQYQSSDDEEKLPEPIVTNKAEAKRLAKMHFKSIEDISKCCKPLEQKLAKLLSKNEVTTLRSDIITLANQLQDHRESIGRNCERIHTYTRKATEELESKEEAKKLHTKASIIHREVVDKQNNMMNLLIAKGIVPKKS
ncbi:MAG: hypothetical protein K2X94_03455 [Amoebophilaceae bacterium]|nr:hypothetical protein [Amoebophilaceae bacterium]